MQVCATSPPLSPPNEMMTFPPADCSEPICEVNAPTASPPSSHSMEQPEAGVRKASV